MLFRSTNESDSKHEAQSNSDNYNQALEDQSPIKAKSESAEDSLDEVEVVDYKKTKASNLKKPKPVFSEVKKKEAKKTQKKVAFAIEGTSDMTSIDLLAKA